MAIRLQYSTSGDTSTYYRFGFDRPYRPPFSELHFISDAVETIARIAFLVPSESLQSGQTLAISFHLATNILRCNFMLTIYTNILVSKTHCAKCSTVPRQCRLLLLPPSFNDTPSIVQTTTATATSSGTRLWSQNSIRALFNGGYWNHFQHHDDIVNGQYIH